MRKSRKVMSAVLATVMICGFAGCGKKNGAGQSSSTKPPVTYNDTLEVWGAYSTAKVIKNPEYNKNHYKLPVKAEVFAARGETESAQIIVTTANKGVNSYTVEKVDLVNSNGDVFLKENVDVYFQWYALVEIKSRNSYENEEFYPTGYTPDALIPQEYSVQYGENKIDSNSNQGITIDFNIPVDTVAGEYTGEYLLKIDGETWKIPVKLTVWDYDLSYTYGMNLWDVIVGFDDIGEMDNKPDELYTAYYEACMKYKINAYHLPNDSTAQGFVASLEKYGKDPAFNGTFLPNIGGNKKKIFSYYTAVAELAIRDELNYFEALAFYHQDVDEPQGDPTKLAKAKQLCENTAAYLQEFASTIEYTMAGFSSLDAELQESIKQSIINTPQVITTYYDASEELQGVVNAFCPTIDYYNNTYSRKTYDYNAEVTNGQKWTYTCLDPYYPYPTYHVDDFLMGGRVLGWMRKDYGIEGYLNWAINDFQATYGNPSKQYVVDPYTNPLRHNMNNIHFANGDGYLFYPMAKYEASEPLPSLRLLSVRDGQEDYDSLCVLEEKYVALAGKYNVANAVELLQSNLQNYYKILYNDSVAYNDDKMFDLVRKSIGGLVQAACDGSNTMVFAERLKSGTIAKLSVYSDAEEVYFNGKKQTAADGIYSYSIDITTNDTVQIDYVINGIRKSFQYRLPKASYVVNVSDIDNASIKVSKGSSFDKRDNEIMFDIISQGGSYVETLSFVPSMSIALPINQSFTNIDEIAMTLSNLRPETVRFSVYLNTGTKKYKVDELVLYGYETYDYVLDRIYSNTTFNALGDVTSISFEFQNADATGALFPSRRISVKEFSYTLM